MTRRLWIGFSVVMVGVLLAGCFDSSTSNDIADRYNGDWEPGTPRQCISDVCLTDPEAPYAKFAKGEYGLNIIADSPTRLIPRGVDGDWAVFQAGIPDISGYEDWIVAYNFSDDRLMEVEGRGDYHMTRTHLADDRAVIYREPRGGEVDYSHMLLWDLASNTSRILDTGLGGGIGGGAVLGFDGQWALFANRGSNNSEENALWAMDVDTDELVKVYDPVLEPDEDGWEQRMGSAGISHGRAFYSVRETHPDEDNRWYIGMVDLETNTRKIFDDEDIAVLDGPELAVGRNHVAWDAGAGHGLWALNFTSGEIFMFSLPGEGTASPGIGGSWAVYKDSTHEQRGSIAVNLDSGERVETRVKLDDEGFAPMTFGAMATDGSRVVGSLTIAVGGLSLPHQNPAFPFWYDLDDKRDLT